MHPRKSNRCWLAAKEFCGAVIDQPGKIDRSIG
jgi:hypothetical protein